MGVRIIQADSNYNGETCAVLYDSVSETAFGPTFEDGDEAQAFLDWMDADDDPRRYSSAVLHDMYNEFRKHKEEQAKEEQNAE